MISSIDERTLFVSLAIGSSFAAGAKSRKSGGVSANWVKNSGQRVSVTATWTGLLQSNERKIFKHLSAESAAVPRCFHNAAPTLPHRSRLPGSSHGPQLNTAAGSP